MIEDPNESPPPARTEPFMESPENRTSNHARTPLGAIKGGIIVKAPKAESLWAEIVVAINYLTRLNLKLSEEPTPSVIRRAVSWFPLVGAGIGLFAACIDWIFTQAGLPGIITASFAVIGSLWLTRALHEEEFASMANRYSRTLEKSQGVGWLREERSVQYGTLAVIIIIIMKIGAIASLSDSLIVLCALVTAGSWSRAMMSVVSSWLRPIAEDPVARYFQRTSPIRTIIALMIGIIIANLAFSTDALYILSISGGIGLVVALLGANHLRGYNGSLLGTTQELVELSVLGVILAIQ
ncbi:MAG: adenosylcobinamide-GDP ribazoletransferase [Alphaproteobacteria bacterium]|nr:adenosylcobinamide-GDP ribazoletransferase [Alphaproteobacteria bacterium]